MKYLANIDEIARIAKMMALSGYFEAKGDNPTAIAKISTQILAGQELGLTPFVAVQSLHVIKGKPTMSANLMAAAVLTHPHYNYKVIQLRDEVVELEFSKDDEPLGTSSFTIQDAIHAETGKAILPGMNGSMIERFPRNMLFARAMSNGVKWFCPDVFKGAAIYTPDELGGKPAAEDLEEFIEVQATRKESGHVEANTVEAEPSAEAEPPTAEPSIIEPPATEPEKIEPSAIATPQPLMTIKTQRLLHALGTCRYRGDQGAWDEARAKTVRLLGGRRSQPVSLKSSKELTEKEALYVVSLLEDRLRILALEVLVTEKGSDVERESVQLVTQNRFSRLEELSGMALIKVVNLFREKHIPIRI